MPDTTVRILTSFRSLGKPGKLGPSLGECQVLWAHMDMSVARSDCQQNIWNHDCRESVQVTACREQSWRRPLRNTAFPYGIKGKSNCRAAALCSGL